jgi:hypothetical protein
MDLTQIFIAISLLVISISIAICTYFVVSLINELKKAVAETTKIIDDAHSITGSIARPVSSFSDFLMGFKNGFQLFNSFFNKDEKKS